MGTKRFTNWFAGVWHFSVVHGYFDKLKVHLHTRVISRESLVHYKCFSHYQPELEHLKDARVLELQTRIAELESQNNKLKQLLGYVEKEPLSSRPIPARVVGRSADNWWQQVTLNRGSLAGIMSGFIVQAEGGLVGLVESVTPNTSRVLLISDFKSQVGVTITRTGAKGVLRGAFYMLKQYSSFMKKSQM